MIPVRDREVDTCKIFVSLELSVRKVLDI